MRTGTSVQDACAEGDRARSHAPRAAATPAPRAQSPASRLLSLQRLAGNAAAMRTITAARTADAPGRVVPRTAGAAGTTIQRKVGFEFESAQWSPWRLLQDHGAPGDDRSGDAAVEPVTRKTVLESGAGFTLEADDTPGPAESNLEFVTEAFDETAAGLGQLERALTEILGVVARLDRYVGRPGPERAGSPPYPVVADRLHELFVGAAEHGFGGSPGLSGAEVLLSGGAPGFPAAMQSTAGLPLADLPELMTRLGAGVPNETPAEQAARRRHRATMWPQDKPSLRSHRIIGSVPEQARIAVENLRGRPGYGPALADDTRDLSGFLAALVMTVAVLQAAQPAPLVKDRLLLMPRNDFVQMFRSLPDGQQIAMRTSPGVLVDEVLRASRTFFTSELTEETPVIPRPNRPAPADTALTTLTIGDWITGIVSGTDHLSQGGMRRWMAARTDVGAAAGRKAVEALESVGTYADDERRADTRKRLFKFENRGLRPNGTPRLAMAAAAENAMEIFRMYMEIRERR